MRTGDLTKGYSSRSVAMTTHHPPQSSVEVKEWVQLCMYLPYVPSWHDIVLWVVDLRLYQQLSTFTKDS